MEAGPTRAAEAASHFLRKQGNSEPIDLLPLDHNAVLKQQIQRIERGVLVAPCRAAKGREIAIRRNDRVAGSRETRGESPREARPRLQPFRFTLEW